MTQVMVSHVIVFVSVRQLSQVSHLSLSLSCLSVKKSLIYL